MELFNIIDSEGNDHSNHPVRFRLIVVLSELKNKQGYQAQERQDQCFWKGISNIAVAGPGPSDCPGWPWGPWPSVRPWSMPDISDAADESSRSPISLPILLVPVSFILSFFFSSWRVWYKTATVVDSGDEQKPGFLHVIIGNTFGQKTQCIGLYSTKNWMSHSCCLWYIPMAFRMISKLYSQLNTPLLACPLWPGYL